MYIPSSGGGNLGNNNVVFDDKGNLVAEAHDDVDADPFMERKLIYRLIPSEVEKHFCSGQMGWREKYLLEKVRKCEKPDNLGGERHCQAPILRTGAIQKAFAAKNYHEVVQLGANIFKEAQYEDTDQI